MTMEQTERGEAPRKRRLMDTSNAEARRAVRETLALFNSWRADLARFKARAARPLPAPTRTHIVDRCRQIQEEVMAARMDLIVSLADAPAKVAGNSRVVDVERALDNLEANIAEIRQLLQN